MFNATFSSHSRVNQDPISTVIHGKHGDEKDFFKPDLPFTILFPDQYPRPMNSHCLTYRLGHDGNPNLVQNNGNLTKLEIRVALLGANAV